MRHDREKEADRKLKKERKTLEWLERFQETMDTMALLEEIQRMQDEPERTNKVTVTDGDR